VGVLRPMLALAAGVPGLTDGITADEPVSAGA
jgi:hypothetical protein